MHRSIVYLVSFVTLNQAAEADTLVSKIGSVAMAPQADYPLGRSDLRTVFATCNGYPSFGANV